MYLSCSANDISTGKERIRVPFLTYNTHSLAPYMSIMRNYRHISSNFVYFLQYLSEDEIKLLETSGARKLTRVRFPRCKELPIRL